MATATAEVEELCELWNSRSSPWDEHHHSWRCAQLLLQKAAGKAFEQDRTDASGITARQQALKGALGVTKWH
jgi:hypothetical protein